MKFRLLLQAAVAALDVLETAERWAVELDRQRQEVFASELSVSVGRWKRACARLLGRADEDGPPTNPKGIRP